MDNVSIIGLDISKRSFQVHGATADGAPVVRRKLTRAKVLEFLASQPPCLVVMETCGGAHHWGREIQQLGHEVRLIAPIYVKAFAKRQKSHSGPFAASPRQRVGGSRARSRSDLSGSSANSVFHIRGVSSTAPGVEQRPRMAYGRGDDRPFERTAPGKPSPSPGDAGPVPQGAARRLMGHCRRR